MITRVYTIILYVILWRHDDDKIPCPEFDNAQLKLWTLSIHSGEEQEKALKWKKTKGKIKKGRGMY